MCLFQIFESVPHDHDNNSDIDLALQSVFDESHLTNCSMKSSDPELDEIFTQIFENTLLQDEEYIDQTFDEDSDVEMSTSADDYNIMTTGTDIEDPDAQPLYPGAAITVGAFMLLLSLFCTKHNPIGDGILQLLNIMAVALPRGHNLCTSLHTYKMCFFQNLQNPLIYHYYCCHCLGYIKDPTLNKCPYSVCSKDLSKNNKSYFLKMPVDIQVKNLFSQKNFPEILFQYLLVIYTIDVLPN